MNKTNYARYSVNEQKVMSPKRAGWGISQVILNGSENYQGWRETTLTSIAKTKILKFIEREEHELNDEDFSDIENYDDEIPDVNEMKKEFVAKPLLKQVE